MFELFGYIITAFEYDFRVGVQHFLHHIPIIRLVNLMLLLDKTRQEIHEIMFIIPINIELLQILIPSLDFRQLFPDVPEKELFRFVLHEMFVVDIFEMSDVPRMVLDLLIEHLPACELDLAGIYYHYHIVSVDLVPHVGRFVLAL